MVGDYGQVSILMLDPTFVKYYRILFHNIFSLQALSGIYQTWQNLLIAGMFWIFILNIHNWILENIYKYSEVARNILEFLNNELNKK